MSTGKCNWLSLYVVLEIGLKNDTKSMGPSFITFHRVFPILTDGELQKVILLQSGLAQQTTDIAVTE